MSKMSDWVRENFKKGDDIRDAGLTTPRDVIRFDDIVYGTDEKWQVLDVYRPADCEGKKLPVIVSVHGGGWVYGDKERYQYYCMSLVKHGFAVVNFTYRLAPEFMFPAPLEDTNLVMEWIVANAKEYGLDTENVFAVGDSAGGHILGLYTAIYTNEDYARNYSFKVPGGINIKAVALNCGVYRVEVKGDEDMTTQLMADYLPEGGSDKELEQICIENHVTEDYLPTMLMTCKQDFLVDQPAIMEKRLIENGVPYQMHYYASRTEELGHVFHLNMKLDKAHECNKTQCEFFKSFL